MLIAVFLLIPTGICVNISQLISQTNSGPGITSETEDDYFTSDDSFEGYTLFSPEYSKYTYLINNNGWIVHWWKSDYIQSFGTYLLENGILYRLDLPEIKNKNINLSWMLFNELFIRIFSRIGIILQR